MSQPRSIADMLAAHPWPREFADARRLEWLWTIDVDGATPQQLWPLLADLSRLNRALKLPVMRFAERDGVRYGSARYTGVKHEWIEVPWNWVAGRWYELFRVYQSGSMRALHGVYELEPTATGSRVHIYYGVVPSSRIFDLGLKFNFGSMGRAYRRLLPRAGAELGTAAGTTTDTPACLQGAPARLPADAKQRLHELRATLAANGQPAEALDKLVDWIATASDSDLERIRVRERARAWSLDEDQLLSTCLHATRAGLLQLTWDVVCPHCRGVRDSTGALAELPTSGECEPCGIKFGTDTANAIEITFHPHPGIRPVVAGVYCSAEPAHKPHIIVQQSVVAGEHTSVTAPAAPGNYRMRIKGEMRGSWLRVHDGGAHALEWTATTPPSDHDVAPGAALTFANPADAPATFIVESAAHLELALRPGRLLSFQEFRDLFSDEYLGSGVQLAVGEQTILFTDLVGSTAMYSERGDPAAFVEVKKHFERVFGLIAAHRGAVVKTIGDAVMGAFNEPLDAVKASHAIHEAFPPGQGPQSLKLRISINSGTCIAVRLNSALDYFGHAVNLAAKLQAAAEAWQIAISDTTLAGPGVADYLAAQKAELVPVEIPLKNIDVPARGMRWTVAREA